MGATAVSQVDAAVDHGVPVTPGQAALRLPDQLLRSVRRRAAAPAVGEPVAGARVHPRGP